MDSLCLVDIYLIHVVNQLQPKAESDTGEVFQTAILGRPKSHEIKHFYLREIQADMYNFECHWRSGGRNNKGMPITHDGNLTDGRGQQWRKDVEIKPFVNRLGLNVQDKLQIFQTDGIISECNEVTKSVNSSHLHHFKEYLLVSRLTFLIYLGMIFCILYYWHKIQQHTGKELPSILSVGKPLVMSQLSGIIR